MSRETHESLPPPPPRDPDALWAVVARAQDDELAEGGAQAQRLARLSARAPDLLRAARTQGGAPGGNRRWRWALPGLALAAAAALWLVLAPGAGTPRPAYVHDGSTLRFADGSRVEVAPGAAVEVERLVGSEADLRLDRGRVTTAVVHAPGTRWRLRAGPFTVRVTGTRFVTRWQPERGALEVTLHEGAVVVEGGPLGAGVPLRAGQRLRADASQGLLSLAPHGEAGGWKAPGEAVEPPGPAHAGPQAPARADAVAAEPEPPASSDARPPVRARAGQPDWVRLALRREHGLALAAAQARGVARLCAESGPEELLLLADLGRYGGRADLAEEALRAVLRRFPRRLEASDALFGLGRLAAERARQAEAIAWFERYASEWPRGPLAAQARARLHELRSGTAAQAEPTAGAPPR